MSTKDREREGCGRGELLVSVLYGEATPEERAELEAHRRECTACEAELASLAGVREELRAWELGVIPHVRVEVRPGFVERLSRAFAILPLSARIVTAGACALFVLALVNTEVTVGSGGVSFRTHLLPQTVASRGAAPAPQLDEERVRQIVAERVDASVREQLVAYRSDMEAQLKSFESQLVEASSADDVKRLTSQVSTQRRRIEQLQRDIDRTAGYGGSDLFSAVLSPGEPGS